MMGGSDLNPNRRRRRAPTKPYTQFDEILYDDKGHRISIENEHYNVSLHRLLYGMLHSAWFWWGKFRRKHGRRGAIRILVLSVSVLVVFVHYCRRQIATFDSTSIFHIRRTSLFEISFKPRRFLKDLDVDQVQILYKHLLFQDETDIGGWRSGTQKFFLPAELTATTNQHDNQDPAGDPDFGDLDLFQHPPFDVLSTRQQNNHNGRRPAREVQPNDQEIAATYWNKMHRDAPLPSYLEPSESIEDEQQNCRRPTFKNRYYPSCNLFHEKDLSRDYDSDRAATTPGDDQVYDSYMINHGYYRDVWVVHQPNFQLKTILKTNRWKHDFKPSILMSTLMDALVMERLTPSPRIVDIYGHCGTAVWVEAIPYEVEEVILHGDGYMNPEQMMNQELRSYNDYTPEEKLEIALAMAESLADMHGYPDGVIVHDDVQPCQWLRTKEGILKLGDFNRAEIMDYNTEKQEYCRYKNGHAYGNYRAPEEFAEEELDEKIDVFSFGNNIYVMLTGLWNFYDNDNDDEVQKLVIDGKRAFVDPRWKDRSYIESQLVDVMERCWEHDPNKRIDIFTVVQLLREIAVESKKHP
ncbi:serine/threonine kinase [Nitzschia inconspicua]|uniref:Serine/threonine kinase n=1 Tax=Nitzschia inconspicua TaxID=303405 RepID=A0A9K3L174_9STRA|nr:serine/threonine kinase [Nitzschia inconspicua]KAG7352935.1 serine/threonine kinase [Nitzschia inconspicua]